MEKIFLSAASLNVTPFDWQEIGKNIKIFLTEIRKKRTNDPKVIVFPELVLCGPGCGHWLNAPSTLEHSADLLTELIPETIGLTAVFGLPWEYRGKCYNAAAVVSDGTLLGFACKRKRIGSDQNDFRDLDSWIGPEKKISVDLLPPGLYPGKGSDRSSGAGRNVSVPIGRERWDLPFGSMCVQIGSDFEMEEIGTGDLLVIPSADFFEFEKRSVLRTRLAEVSRKFAAAAYANLMGNESGSYVYDGASAVISGGTILTETARFSFSNGATASVSVESGKSVRKKNLPAWERNKDLVYEEFARVIPQALFDYMRKSRSNGFTLSLSGGADSGAIAVMIRLMTEYGLTGPREDFLQKLAFIPSVALLMKKKKIEAVTPKDLTAALLTTIYQATSSSGKVTKNAAKKLADFIGAVHFQISIDEQTESYKELISKAIGRPLTWEKDDLALQNIQARVRAPGVWLLANLTGSLLLTTGNRSEASVGYATMDGDTCGGLAPLAGIDKAFLRKWLRWMEAEGPAGSHAFPVLKLINDQAPTAELRPGGHQTDEGDLMPYPILDLFEKAVIRMRLPAAEALAYVEDELKRQKSEAKRKDLIRWQIRFYQRWTASQWKRERCAPAFHFDDRDLSPKGWCRFPVLSAGFQKEITELKDLLSSEF